MTLSVARTSYAAKAVLTPHYHAGASLSLVLRGSYEERVGSLRGLCTPLMVAYKPPDVEHCNVIGNNGLDALFIETDAEWSEQLALGVTGVTSTYFVSDGEVRRAAITIARASNRGEPFSTLLLDQLLVATLSALRVSHWCERSPMPRWLRLVRERIEDDPAAHHTLRELAASAEVHPVYLAQSFRRQFGMTVHGFVVMRRIAKACELLAMPSHSIGSIALITGFTDHAHFTRTFRDALGITPREYRRCTSHSVPHISRP